MSEVTVGNERSGVKGNHEILPGDRGAATATRVSLTPICFSENRFSLWRSSLSMHHASLFTPVTLGSLTIPNRIVMSALTRCRADPQHVPTDLMVEYYAQRASAGLILAEATMVMEGHSAFGGRDPGIYSAAQVAGWKKVTDAVHAKGGRIFSQLWHGGRWYCHPRPA